MLINTMTRTELRTVWLLRALLASLLLIGSEIIFWSIPPARSPLDWLLVAAACFLLATLLLDFAVRYRVRDIWGLMLLLGVIGVLNGLLIHPESALGRVPESIMGHGLGGHWLTGLQAFGVFYYALHPERHSFRRLMMGAVGVGFFWGVWAQWLPVYNPDLYLLLPTGPRFALFAGLLLIPASLLLLLRSRTTIPAASLKLGRRGGAVALIGVAGLYIVRLFTDAYGGGGGMLASLVLIAIFWTILWFRSDTRRPLLIAPLLEPHKPSWVGLVSAVLVFMLMALGGVALPLVSFLVPNTDAYRLMTLAFAGIGTLWPPLVAAVLGAGALNRQVRTNNL